MGPVTSFCLYSSEPFFISLLPSDRSFDLWILRSTTQGIQKQNKKTKSISSEPLLHRSLRLRLPPPICLFIVVYYYFFSTDKRDRSSRSFHVVSFCMWKSVIDEIKWDCGLCVCFGQRRWGFLFQIIC